MPNHLTKSERERYKKWIFIYNLITVIQIDEFRALIAVSNGFPKMNKRQISNSKHKYRMLIDFFFAKKNGLTRKANSHDTFSILPFFEYM